MQSIKEINDLISQFNANDRHKTFAEFIAVLLKDKFVEIYLGDSYEEVSTEQISVSYPAVFCGKIIGAFKECIILNSFGGGKSKALGNIVFINERAIRAMSELDGVGTVNELFIKSGAESLDVKKAFVDLNKDTDGS